MDVGLGDVLDNNIVRNQPPEPEYETDEEPEIEWYDEEKEKRKLLVCRPSKKGVYKPITGDDYIKLERMSEFGEYPESYMRRLRAFIMRGYSFNQAIELLRPINF